jgi:YcxB-like protein
MQVVMNVTPEEYKQALQLNRARYYWWILLNGGFGGVVLLVVGLCFIVSRFLGGQRFDAGLAVLLLIPASWTLLRWHRIERIIAQMAEKVSGTASLEREGVRLTKPSGTTTFVPWARFTGWNEGPNVFTLKSKDSLRVIPKRWLEPQQEVDLRSLLQSKIS